MTVQFMLGWFVLSIVVGLLIGKMIDYDGDDG